MGIFTKLVVSGLLASLIISIFLYPIDELNSAYGADIETTNLTSLNKLSELNNAVTDGKTQVTENSEVGTQESEASFFTNAFTFGKFMVTGEPFKIVNKMLIDFVNVTNIPWAIYVFLISALSIFVTVGIVKSITGR